MNSYGIDYGMGISNIDPQTGIRFGVIPMNTLAGEAWEDLEADYGEPHCPKCGNEAVEYDGEARDEFDQYTHSEWDGYTKHGCCDFVCESCEIILDSGDVLPQDPIRHTLTTKELRCQVDGDGIDLFITKSPWFTFAQFCSPCAPGACYLKNPVDQDGPRAYCLPEDWFDKYNPCPYPIWRVADDALIYSPPEEEEE